MSDTEKNTFILLSRKLLNSEIFSKPPMYLKLWIYILNKAQFKDYKNIKRGQLFTTIDELREACSHYVGYRKEIPTRDEIYKILRWLRNDDESNKSGDMKASMIEVTKATHGMLITVVNYSLYQDVKTYESNNESNNESQIDEQRKISGINNKYKECNNNVLKNDKNVNNEELKDKNIARFVKPSIEEIKSYINENLFKVDAEQFYDYYSANGWLVGKNKMKDWKATIRNWDRKAIQTKKETKGKSVLDRLKDL